MPKEKIPLPELVERDRMYQNGFGWAEFERIAKLPADKKMSFKSLGHMFGRNERTIARWMKRYNEEIRK